MIRFADRLKSVEEYYFSTKLREVRGLIDEGKPIINMGIGSPDLSPPQEVLTSFQNSLFEEGAHQYQSYKGLPELRQTISAFYSDKFGVETDPETEVLPLMGSKEGIMHISMAFLNKDDEVLIPNPGYDCVVSSQLFPKQSASIRNPAASNIQCLCLSKRKRKRLQICVDRLNN